MTKKTKLGTKYTDRKMMYFAYGSNMNVPQMAKRCPGAQIVGKAILPAHHLLFRGVADVSPGGKHVDGVVWSINIYHLRALDRYEGWPNLYNDRKMDVILESGYQVSAMFYYMTYGEIAPPTPNYYKTILDGYKYFGIDPTPLRNAAERALKEDAWYRNLLSTDTSSTANN